MQTEETAMRSIGTHPYAFADYKFLSWYQRAESIGIRGFLRIFDLKTWSGIFIYLGVKIALISVKLQGFSTAAFFVFGCFLEQPQNHLRGASDKMNVGVLIFAAFMFCKVFKHFLLSTLNPQFREALVTWKNLLFAFKTDVVRTICLSRSETGGHWFDLESTNQYFRILGLLRRERGRIHPALSRRACVGFLMQNVAHAAILPGPGKGGPMTYLHDAYMHSNILVAEPTILYFKVAYTDAPWQPLAKRFRRVLGLIFAANLDLPYRDMLMSNADAPRAQRDVPEPSSSKKTRGVFSFLILNQLSGIICFGVEILYSKFRRPRRFRELTRG